MCDCYTGVCQGCERQISIHIGDFSQARTNVRAYCPRCHELFMTHLIAEAHGHDSQITVFVSTIEGEEQVQGLKRGVVLFMVEAPHGIHLN